MSYSYDTSLPAYKEAKLTLNQTQAKVLEAIRHLGICNDRQITEYLGWPINRITPRRLELLTLGKIREIKKDKDPLTNRTTSWWVVTKIIHQAKLF